MNSNENEEDSFLIEDDTIALEKSNGSEVTSDGFEEEKEKTELIVTEDLKVDVSLSKSQSTFLPINAAESTEVIMQTFQIFNILTLYTYEFIRKLLIMVLFYKCFYSTEI